MRITNDSYEKSWFYELLIIEILESPSVARSRKGNGWAEEEFVQDRCTKSAKPLHKVCKASAQSVQPRCTSCAD